MVVIQDVMTKQKLSMQDFFESLIRGATPLNLLKRDKVAVGSYAAASTGSKRQSTCK